MTTVAFLGLGAMGAPMAQNLVTAGFPVRVWNRTKAKARGIEGAFQSPTPADAVRGAAFVLTMVADDAALEPLATECRGVMGPGAVHVSMSTVSPALVGRLAARHAEAGQGFVAAPVFGRPDAAAAGKLWIVAGGPAALLERCAPLFTALGQGTYRYPTAEQAAQVKLAGNFLLGATIEALAEALALGERGGVDPKALLAMFSETLFGSRVVQGYGPRIVERKFTPPGFAVPLARKDFGLVLDAARAAGLAMPIAELVAGRLDRLAATGRHGYDFAGISEVVGE